MKPTMLRWLAILIAMLAVLDPALTSRRAARPVVSLLATGPGGAATADRVERTLSRRFEVIRGGLGGAAATVLVGTQLPDEPILFPAPTLAVLPAATQAPRITELSLPPVARRDSRIPVDVAVSTTGGQGQQLEVSLEAGGLVVDRRTLDLAQDSVVSRVRLAWVPAAAGAVPVRVMARLSRSRLSAAATGVVDVTGQPFRILVIDSRPSWHSTFVRRAVQEDSRFVVTHRLVTSRGVANLVGTPPSSLVDYRALAGYHAVVVGAADLLGAAEVAGLESYLRLRAGRVLVLLDRRAPGPIDRLLEVPLWRVRRLASPAVVAVDSGELRGTEFAWPASLPPVATAVGAIQGGGEAGRGTPLWSAPVGAGRILVSGALNAWQHRDPGTSDFNRLWRQLIAQLASETPALVEVRIARASLRPGERTVISAAVLGDAAGEAGSFTTGVSARLISSRDTVPVRLWPSVVRGRFTGELVAPRAPGTYRLEVGSDVAGTVLPVVVDPLAAAPQPDESALVTAFAASRGGVALPDADVERLPALLAPAFRGSSRVLTWHPMRSAWWIVPFALALGAEWWWRRRRGLQ